MTSRQYRSFLLFGLVWSVCAVWLVSTASVAEAQATSATLSGTVTDERGASVSDAQVRIENGATTSARLVITDPLGLFGAAVLLPGNYLIAAHLDGFPLPNRTAETCVVNGQSARPSGSPSVGTVIDRQSVENVPLNGRSLQALLQLVPGVVFTNTIAPGQFSVNGQRTTSNNFIVDGINTNTGVDIKRTDPVSAEDAEEFRIETSRFAPEFGRRTGAQELLQVQSEAPALSVHSVFVTLVRRVTYAVVFDSENQVDQPQVAVASLANPPTIGPFGPLRESRRQ